MDDLCEATLERMFAEFAPGAEKLSFRPNEVAYFHGQPVLLEDGVDASGLRRLPPVSFVTVEN